MDPLTRFDPRGLRSRTLHLFQSGSTPTIDLGLRYTLVTYLCKQGALCFYIVHVWIHWFVIMHLWMKVWKITEMMVAHLNSCQWFFIFISFGFVIVMCRSKAIRTFLLWDKLKPALQVVSRNNFMKINFLFSVPCLHSNFTKLCQTLQ